MIKNVIARLLKINQQWIFKVLTLHPDIWDDVQGFMIRQTEERLQRCNSMAQLIKETFRQFHNARSYMYINYSDVYDDYIGSIVHDIENQEVEVYAQVIQEHDKPYHSQFFN